MLVRFSFAPASIIHTEIFLMESGAWLHNTARITHMHAHAAHTYMHAAMPRTYYAYSQYMQYMQCVYMQYIHAIHTCSHLHAIHILCNHMPCNTYCTCVPILYILYMQCNTCYTVQYINPHTTMLCNTCMHAIHAVGAIRDTCDADACGHVHDATAMQCCLMPYDTCDADAMRAVRSRSR
jgi:hypothetical protein